jgi:UDP-N-acetylglucosamine transferase subunit ALG13
MSAVTARAAAEVREPAGPRIVVTVGTDHHPFDRLIVWTNDWLAQHPDQIHGFFVQSGAASVIPACPSARFLETAQLNALLDEADAMVCHGGPGSIADAWARGQVPIVVPRLRRLGEVVDDHQVDFCRKLAELGRIRLAQEPTDLAGLLDDAARDHIRFRLTGPAADVDAAVARFGELVDELAGRPPRRLPVVHLRRRIRRRPETGTGVPAVVGNPSPGPDPAASSNWHASGSSARAGLAGMANEEQE